MTEIVHKGKWVTRESDGDIFWYYESTCKKCGVPVFIALDSARLQTLLCANCYSTNANQLTEENKPKK